MADLDKINQLVSNKDFIEAKELIIEALKEEPSNIELIKLGGLVSVNLMEWQEARQYFETVIKYESNDATSLFYLANCYEKLGDFISSKNSYEAVIKLRPEYVDAYKSLCVILLKLGDIESTIEYAKKASEYDKESEIYDFIIGNAYMKSKEFEKALPYISSALEKAPEHLGIINSLGTCFMALSKFDEAIETYKKAMDANPDNSMTYFNIGSVYQVQQQHELACKYFRKAVELDEDEAYLNALAMSEVKLQQYENALTHYKQLALLCPGKENYKYNMITCLEALGQLDTAIKMLENMLYVNPKFILPAQKLASLYIKTNQLVKAKEIYDKILLKNKLTAETMHQYAILSSSLCDTDTAEKMLKKVIRMDSTIAKAHKDLGIIYLNKRLFNYAEEEFKIALELAPDDFEILFEYGNFLYSISKNQEAEKYYAKTLEIQPNNVIALTFMALNKLVLNQLDDAREYIMKASKLEPNHEYVQFCTGRILYARKEFEEAKPYLIRSFEQNKDIETENTLALTYYGLEDYKQALNIFKNIDSKRQNNTSVIMYIAKCYEKLEDNDKALEHLYKLVDIFPDYEEAHEMIRRLS